MTVASAAPPMTGQQDGRASNTRRDIARSAPATERKAPTAAIGIIRIRSNAIAEKNRPSPRQSTPRINGAAPVRAPKR